MGVSCWGEKVSIKKEKIERFGLFENVAFEHRLGGDRVSLGNVLSEGKVSKAEEVISEKVLWTSMADGIREQGEGQCFWSEGTVVGNGISSMGNGGQMS